MEEEEEEEEEEEKEDNNATQPMKVSSEEDVNESNMIRPFKSLGKGIDHLTISNEPVSCLFMRLQRN